MSKFNETAKGVYSTPDQLNFSNFPGFSRTDFEQELVSVVLNSMLNGDSFYETEKDRMKKIEYFVKENPLDSKFLAQLIIFTRNEANLRSVSHFLSVLLVENVKGKSFVRKALFKTLIRPDDATEMVALWNSRHPNTMVPNALRRAIKDSLESKWDNYRLKKYFGTGAVKVSDLIKFSRPSPKDEEQERLFKNAIEGNLENIETAQTVNATSTGNDRANNYRNMLLENKLGYMALLKNLKNILEVDKSDEMIDLLISSLKNERAVLKSRVLPFRFVQAYETVSALDLDAFKRRKIMKSIENGFSISARNISIVDENDRIAILLDESGSMGGFGWGTTNSKQPFEIGKVLMASILSGLKTENVIGYLWADRTREVSIDSSPLEFVKNTRTRGGGTDLSSPIKTLINNKTVVDKLVIFTDMQQNRFSMFHTLVNKYKSEVNKDVKILFWNLNGYGGATPIRFNKDVLEVAGFSDKILEVISYMWEDKDAFINKIKQIEI